MMGYYRDGRWVLDSMDEASGYGKAGTSGAGAYDTNYEALVDAKQRIVELEQRFKVCNDLLIESQAREAKLRDDLRHCKKHAREPVWVIWHTRKGLALPTDDTALKEALKAEREKCEGLRRD